MLALSINNPDLLEQLTPAQRSVGFVHVANACFSVTESDCFGYVAQDAFAGRRWLQRAHYLLHSTGKGLLGFIQRPQFLEIFN